MAVVPLHILLHHHARRASSRGTQRLFASCFTSMVFGQRRGSNPSSRFRWRLRSMDRQIMDLALHSVKAEMKVCYRLGPLFVHSRQWGTIKGSALVHRRSSV